MEIWKNIKGYEGIYEVSDLGNIKNIKLNRNLKGCKDKNGYIISILTKNNIKKTIKIHRLVAISFLDNTENKPMVNHINGIKHDNRLCNLEWCTAKENSIHAIKNGLNNPAKGNNCNFSKNIGGLNVNSRKIINIKTNQTFDSIKEASDFYKIKYNILSKNINGQNINKTDLIYHPCIVGLTTPLP